jgi:hypothetical protein
MEVPKTEEDRTWANVIRALNDEISDNIEMFAGKKMPLPLDLKMSKAELTGAIRALLMVASDDRSDKPVDKLLLKIATASEKMSKAELKGAIRALTMAVEGRLYDDSIDELLVAIANANEKETVPLLLDGLREGDMLCGLVLAVLGKKEALPLLRQAALKGDSEIYCKFGFLALANIWGNDAEADLVEAILQRLKCRDSKPTPIQLLDMIVEMGDKDRTIVKKEKLDINCKDLSGNVGERTKEQIVKTIAAGNCAQNRKPSRNAPRIGMKLA